MKSYVHTLYSEMHLLNHRIIIFLLILPLFLCELHHKVTSKVFFTIDIGGISAGDIVIGLFGDKVPRTVKNFQTIAETGIDGRSYAGTTMIRLLKQFMIQGGDILYNNGSGSTSIYGKSFPDENFLVQHTGPGYLSMKSSGPNTNGCQFYILLTAAPWLDRQQVVFGKVVEGAHIVHKIEDLETDIYDRPILDVYIRKCGVIPVKVPFLLPESAFNFAAPIKAGIIPLFFIFSLIQFLD